MGLSMDANLMKKREVTYDQWQAEAIEMFGDERMAWRFVCPSCGHVASVRDYKNAGATAGQVGFSCIGRALGAGDEHTFRKSGGPCNYAGGGLIGLNPVAVIFPDGKRIDVFEFAKNDQKQ